MSKERYFDLYRQFLNNTISDKDYKDLMKWVSDEKNDATLRRYMETLWSENDWVGEEQAADWATFKKQFEANKRSSAKVLSLGSGSRRISRVWSYAAAVVILVLGGYGLMTYWEADDIFYQTAYGETLEIQLEDGSLVTLNANSRLEWESNWERSGERHVKLTGEAFFDVVHTSDDAGFTVETEDLNVRVLGTTFNVSARRDHTGVTLETGRIELDLKQEEEEQSLTLEPGDFVRFSASTKALERSKVQSIDESTDWMAGVLRFEDVTVREMFNEIEDQYGKKLMTTDSTLLARRMFTGIPYEDWTVAKEALELALGVKFEERNNELYIQE